MIPELRLDQWMAIELISLDLVLPWYAAIGLSDSSAVVLNQASKELILASLGGDIRKLASANLILESATTRVAFTAYQEKLLAALGDSEFTWLLHWIRYVHSTEDDNPWRHVKRVLSRWAGGVWNRQIDSLGLASDPLWLGRRFRAEVVEESERVAFGAIQAADLSVWDLALFTRGGYLEIPPGSSFLPFEDDLSLSASMFAFQVFVAKRVLNLPEVDINRIDEHVRSRQESLSWPGLRRLPGLNLVVSRCGRGTDPVD